MAKIQKKISNNLVVGLIGLAVIAFGAVTLVAAYGESIVNNFYGEATINQAPDGGDMLGSMGLDATTTIDMYSNFTNINVEKCIRMGDDVFDQTDSESIIRCLIVQDFTDATITPVALDNPYDENDTVYIRDLWLELVGKATTTIRMIVTTSTASFLSGDNVTYLVDDAGAATLMRTFGTAWGADAGAVATGTNFFLTQWAGTNTDVANSQLPIEWKNDEYILVFATSSGDRNLGITGTGNTFDGELYMLVDIVK